MLPTQEEKEAKFTDPLAFLESITPEIIDKITDVLKRLGSIKYTLVMKIIMSNINFEIAQTYFISEQEVMTEPIIISSSLDKSFHVIEEGLEKFNNNGFGWSVDSIENLTLEIAKYTQLKHGTYIDLPLNYKNKKANINVKNEDDNCLRWALRPALFPVNKHVDRPSSYPTSVN